MLYLQNRWKLVGQTLIYYGMRKQPNLLKNTVKISKVEVNIIRQLPRVLNTEEVKKVNKLIKNGIIVEKEFLKKTPKNYDEAQYCRTCAGNDFMIPGLEFNEHGLCPMCASKNEVEHIKSVVPTLDVIPKTKKSRFDIALFYTGGKDSTYLLYYLSKVLNLKVLALTWEIPYMSTSAIKSIENAKQKLHNVEFISRKVANVDLIKMYSKLYELSGNTCSCPSLAYVLFYPELVANTVPYFVAGNEPVQLQGLYYNQIAPRFAYTFYENKLINGLINLGRILTLHPPLKRGQLHTLITMKELARGNKFLNVLKYKNELLKNICISLKEIKYLTMPLKKAIRMSSRSGHIPAFINIDLNKVAGGVYDWRKVKDLIVKEAGWIAPSDDVKGLHTSCSIEKCKEYSQFIRFYHMESTMIPFSAIEISLASQKNNASREDALLEIKNCMGFSLEEISECQMMKDYLSSLENSD